MTNFQHKDILGDSTKPSGSMPWGFYWWDNAHQGSMEKDYKQKMFRPHYQLFPYPLATSEGVAIGHLRDAGHLLATGSAMLRDQLMDYVQWSKNTVSILAVNSFNSAAAAAAVTIDTVDHAVYNSLGFLGLIHSSTATMTIPVHIPAGATSLSFGYKFLYGSSNSTFEVFINDKPIYHTNGEVALDEGMQLVPWLNVKEYAGSTINLNLRCSNPEDGIEGKVRIDDLVVARITSGKKFPWPMFLPAISGH